MVVRRMVGEFVKTKFGYVVVFVDVEDRGFRQIGEEMGESIGEDSGS